VNPELEEKLEASSSWTRIKQAQDLIELLKLIRSHAHMHDEVKQGTMSLVEHDLDLYLNYQHASQDLSTFYKLFKARCEVIETFGGHPGFHPVLYLKHRKKILEESNIQPIPPATEAVVTQLSKAQNNEAMKAACEEYKAALFIRISNESRYGVIKKKLDNMYLFDQEAYPKTLERAYNYLLNYQVESGGGFRQQQRNTGQEGVAFVQQGGGERRKGLCFHCGQFGHIAAQCDELLASEKQKLEQATKGGQTHVNVGDEDEVKRANDELQECLQGVANVHVGIDELSIGSLDDDQGWVDGVAFQSVVTV